MRLEGVVQVMVRVLVDVMVLEGCPMKRQQRGWMTRLVGAAAIGCLLLGADPVAQERHVVRMVAERFTFTPSRIEVPVGTTVEIRITSEDTDHGFHIVGGPNVIVPKRRQGEAVVLFEADTPGAYHFECSKLCGAGHNFMKGEIIVTAGPGTADAAGAGAGAGADSDSDDGGDVASDREPGDS